MMLELGVAALLVCGAGVPLVLALTLPGRRRQLALAALVVLTLGAAVGLSLVRTPPTPEEQVAERPIRVPSGSYVSSDACRSCHPDQYASWHDSFHRSMTRLPTPANVFGRFEGMTLDANRLEYRLERRGDRFWVEVPDLTREGWPHVWRRIELVTGSHHEQIYWYGTGETRRLQILPVVWHVAEARWLPLDAVFLTPPTEPAPDPRVWNLACAKCHTTNTQPWLRAADDMDTRVADFGIACEACHGPGDEHVRANQDPARRYALHLSGDADATIVNPARLDSKRASHVCAQCHSLKGHASEEERHFRAGGHRFRPGDDLEEHHILVRWGPGEPLHPLLQVALRGDPHYLADRLWPDGAVRVTGREFSGLLESACFQGGDLDCLDCHRLHQDPADVRERPEWANDQLAADALEDGACLECHSKFAANPTEHTHHAPDSSGSRCYNCHMPFTSYGLLKAVRSHQIDSPNVGASRISGRPDACSQCHLDRSRAWTSSWLETWYGHEPLELDAEETRVASAASWALRGDAGQRALMAWSMGWDAARETTDPGWFVPYLAQLLDDPYPAVRFIAARSLRRIEGVESLAYDYVAPREERVPVTERVLARWVELGLAAPARYPAETLVRSDGSLDADTFLSLLSRRNDRRISLVE